VQGSRAYPPYVNGMALIRAKLRWSIPGAGNAFSVLHFDGWSAGGPNPTELSDLATKLNAFVTSIKAYLPNVVTVQVMNEMEEINEATGEMIGVFSTTVLAAQAGTASATAGWAAAAGAVITWNTPGVRNGRRVRGRTFIVPLSNEAWDVDGSLKAVPLNGLNSAATALRTASGIGQLQVWSRPSAPGASDGVAFEALSHRIPDFSAILRSRRA
jgi:hypothetical protein